MADEAIEEEEQKEPKCNCPEGAPLWMVTFSDMTTLLLTFFVLLLSMSSTNPVKYHAATSSIQEAFGINSQNSRVSFYIPVLPSRPVTKFLPLLPQLTSKVYSRVKAQIDDMKLGKQVEAIKRDSNTIVLRLSDSILFAPGESQLQAKAYPTLRHLADIIRPLPADVRIEGFTDDTPHGFGPIGNWNLSVDRSVAVMRFFKKGDLLPMDRLSAIGYGEDRPVVPNTDAKSRALNRRVDFVLHLKTPDQKDNGNNLDEHVPL